MKSENRIKDEYKTVDERIGYLKSLGIKGEWLQRLLGHTTLMMTNRYCQAVGCYDAVEAHTRYLPIDNLVLILLTQDK